MRAARPELTDVRSMSCGRASIQTETSSTHCKLQTTTEHLAAEALRIYYPRTTPREDHVHRKTHGTKGISRLDQGTDEAGSVALLGLRPISELWREKIKLDSAIEVLEFTMTPLTRDCQKKTHFSPKSAL